MRIRPWILLLACSLVIEGCQEPGATDDAVQKETATSADEAADSEDAVNSDAAACQHWHYPQDYMYGEDCWAPPENLCRNGATTDFAWFCKTDGSLCCFSNSGSCFLCGFVRCGSPGTPLVLTDECQAIDIPQKYLDCAQYLFGEGEDCLDDVREQMRNGAECQNPFEPEAPQYMYCWDQYVD